MDLQLKGKTALVTGASQGIGQAIARQLAEEGVQCVTAARRKEQLDLDADAMAKRGLPRPITMKCDVMAEGAVQTLAADALKALGRIDILINCAGGSRPLPVDAPEEKWVEAMTLNFTRLRQLTHAVLPSMVANRWGRIVNITGKSEPEGLNAAFSAKAAVHAWAKGLSREIGRHGITINSIPPGKIMSEQIRRNYPPEVRAEQSAQEIPVGRYGEPEELGVLAVFLCSPLAGYITGTVLPVDGGLRRYSF